MHVSGVRLDQISLILASNYLKTFKESETIFFQKEDLVVMMMLYLVATRKVGAGMLMMTLNFLLTLKLDPHQLEGTKDILYRLPKALVSHR